MIAWGLWQQRNRMRMHQPSWHLHENGDRAKELVREFFDAHKPFSSLPRGERCVRCIPPLLGCLRLMWMLPCLRPWIALELGLSFGIMKGESLLLLVNVST